MVRTSRTNRIGVTHCQAQLFFRLARKDAYRSIDDVERVLRFGVAMPRDRLAWTDLQLCDTEPGTNSVMGTTFNFVCPTCVVWRLHENSLQFHVRWRHHLFGLDTGPPDHLAPFL